ncbi:TetR/AcrR family transcriptional regulator [Tsukamurella sp. 8F]|uniref:TetR/AcrR family transcriptional regulator n=1 Tax=unclassified Tsukamurella TaxID=2633480 RepID=UPI0023B99AAE|nr:MULTISPECIES: TetR/AcrR family transcriptional regulator [unclassified Tsukamurella]MDF0529356.1 TetR/AcrR family transcriptional regulator [Tsukamurella sp. 8J]MDF0587137.1 TetR/AcrR family transcriptional regulator [Tsukamurella sp. 8F]
MVWGSSRSTGRRESRRPSAEGRRRPWDKLSVRDIAAHAEASTTSIYTLFGGKDELGDAVRRHALGLLHRALLAAPASSDPVADLLAISAAYRRWAITETNLYRVVFGGAVTYVPAGVPQDHDPAAPLVDAIRRVRGAAFGIEDANRVGVAVWALLHGLVTLQIDGTVPGDYVDTVVPGAVRALVNG